MRFGRHCLENDRHSRARNIMLSQRLEGLRGPPNFWPGTRFCRATALIGGPQGFWKGQAVPISCRSSTPPCPCFKFPAAGAPGAQASKIGRDKDRQQARQACIQLTIATPRNKNVTCPVSSRSLCAPTVFAFPFERQAFFPTTLAPAPN